MQKLLTFFQQKKKCVYVIFNDQSFNNTLTNKLTTSLVLNDWAQNIYLSSHLDQHCLSLCFDF